MNRMAFAVACVWVAATAGMVRGQGGGREDLTAYLPPGQAQARDLVAKECSMCHDLRGVLQLRKNAKDWEAIVLDMGARGALITVDDVDPMTGYLADVFGPDSPPFTDVSTASRDDLTKLPGVTAAAADKLIALRTSGGALSSPEEVQAALGLDAKTFERIKPYVYVKPKGR
jgi:hypothetical protein